MPTAISPRLRFTALILTAFLSSGCAHKRTPVAAVAEVPEATSPAGAANTIEADGSEPEWHSCRIRMARDEAGAVRWSLDTLLAHRIFATPLDRHGEHIELWRFHRRAANDAAGHRFSFIFYAAPNTADQIAAEVLGASVLQTLQQDGLVKLARCDNTGGWRGAGVADTSDPSWAPEIQRAWPAFIMGTSRFWLNMIDELVEPAIAGESLEDSVARYQRANARLTRLWAEQGQHALLHHLNAMFGYRPLLIRY